MLRPRDNGTIVPRITVNRRSCIWIALLSLLVGGVRFSDGSLLLAMASDHGLDAPAFAAATTQYVWDSPLKVLFVELLPANIIVIALAFAALAALPLAGLLAHEDSRLFGLSSVLVMLTPALKVSFQNVGVGDGLVYALIVAAVASESRVVIGLSFLGLGLWHPQQAFFVAGSYAIYSRAFEGAAAALRIKAGLSGVVMAGLAFAGYRMLLPFHYYDRLQYLVDRSGDLPLRNLPYLPLSAFFVLFWTYATKRLFPATRLPAFAIAWLAVLVGIAIFTTDVTRVLSIIALPCLLIPMKAYMDATPRPIQLPLAWVALSVAWPVFSWSGVDLFLWPDLLRDLCKYEVACLT